MAKKVKPWGGKESPAEEKAERKAEDVKRKGKKKRKGDKHK